MKQEANEASKFKNEVDTILAALSKPANDGKVIKVPVHLLNTTKNVRKEIVEDEKFTALLNSIKEYGILQPLVISKHEGKISVVAGHRRLKALQKLGLEQAPVMLKVFDGDKERTVVQLVENLVREDLEPIDHAEAVAQLKIGEGVSATKLSALLGYKDRKFVERLCKVAGWPEEAKRLAKDLELSLYSLRRIASNSYSSERELIESIENWNGGKKKTPSSRSGAKAFDETTTRSLDHWFKNTEVSKDQKSKFKTVAKIYGNLEPQSREMLKDLLETVWN